MSGAHGVDGERPAGRSMASAEACPEGGAREVLRFGATERLFHWAVALPFLVLLGSGLALTYPAVRGLIFGYSAQVGLRLHLAAAVFLLLGPPLAILLGDRCALRDDARDFVSFGRREGQWLRRMPRWLLGLRTEMPPMGRFNAGQKLHALFIGGATVLLTLTGAILWLGVPSGSAAWREVVALSRRLHTLVTLVVIPPLAAHVFVATLHPRTREALRGILFGTVAAHWAAEHHPAWYPTGGEFRDAGGPRRSPGARQGASGGVVRDRAG